MSQQRWQCFNCGKQCTTGSKGTPTPQQTGQCVSNPSKNHVWQKLG